MNPNEGEQLDKIIRNSPNLLASIIGSAMDAIIAVDDAQHIILFNAAAERVFACPASEAIGSCVERFIPERFRTGHSTRVQRFGESGVTNRTLHGLGTLWGLRATGEEFPIEASVSKVESGDKRFFTVVIRDITERQRAETERRQAEQALRQSEEKFMKAFQGSPVAITLAKVKDRRFIEVNDTFERLLGYRREEAIGRTPTDLELWVDPSQREELRKQLLSERSLRDLELRFRVKNGSVITCSVSAELIQVGEEPCILTVASDITQRKLAVQELATANERLRLAIESGSIGGFDYDLKTGKNVWFGNAHTLLGMSPDETSGSLHEFWDRVHKDDLKRVQRAIQGASETDEGFNEEFRVVWRDGTTHWLRSRGRYCYAANGERQRMVGVSVDITERKMAEEVVRKSEERFRLAALAGRMFAYEWDPATDVITRSGDFAQILGSDEPVETTGQQISGRIHPDDREMVKAAIAALSLENPHLQISYRMARRDGTFIWVERNTLAHFDEQGRMLRLIGMIADVTERKQAEQVLHETNRALETQTVALRSQEELLKIFVKNVPAGVAMLDREMRYLQVSERWCADYGVDASQVLGRSHYEIFPDIPQRWKELHQRGLAGETSRAEEDRWDRRGGLATWVRWEIRPWKTPSGGVGGILIFAEDITNQKQTEDALSGMSRKLIETQEQERARIGRELHDDINQRLAMLAVELDQLQENPPEVLNRLQELRKEVADISSDVQALSHELHSSKLEYLGVVAGIKSWCKEFAERQRMEIDFKNEVSSALPFDAGLSLFRVIQEALHNAQKHSGVKRIEVQLGEQSKEVHLTVSDSGRGFDVEAAKQGRGLGLISMRERVRLVNGTMSIESKPMGGTTIHVRVPLDSAEASERKAV